MIRFSGRGRQLGALILILSAGCLFLHPVFAFVSQRVEPVEGQSAYQNAERDLSIRLRAAAIELLIWSVPCCAFGFVGWRFLLGGVAARIDREGLAFPIWPGSRWERRVLWEDVAGVEAWSPGAVSAVQRFIFGMAKWGSGNGPCLGIHLNRPAREIEFGQWWVRLLCRLNESALSGLAPGEAGKRLVLEFFQVTEAPFDVVVAGINALIENPALREEYLTPGEETRMAQTEDGQIAFVRVAKPLDWWDGAPNR